jgi:hypothetical protein
MPSLSEWDRGTMAAEGRTYADDIAAGNLGMQILLAPLRALQARQKAKGHKVYKPKMHFCLGNHEQRIERHVNGHRHLKKTLGYHCLDLAMWKVHDFLKIVKIDGIAYAHFFPNPMSGKPWGGQALQRLRNIGFSFTMGHQQGKLGAERFLQDGTGQRALVVGSYYLHDEDYKGSQGNHHWRGVVMKYEVRRGNYDLLEISIDYLRRRYEERHPNASKEAIKYIPEPTED